MPIDLFNRTLAHGTTLACRAAGSPDAPRRALFLHGFPEAAFVWDGLMQRLVAAEPGLYCVAPNQRGYAGSSAPADVAAYRAKHLVADVLALVDTLGSGPLYLLVAHDWGGGVAWNLAALAPGRVRQLVIINAPHPGALLRELRDNPAQQAASRYMNNLVQPQAAQRLAADDFAALWALFEHFGQPAAWLTPALRDVYRAVWSHGLDGALNWYRASPLRPPTGPADAALTDLVLSPSVLQVAVPTTVLWGEADHALLPGLLNGLGDWVPQLEVHRHRQASHWVVHEQPDWVLAQVLSALGQSAGAA